MLDIRYWQLLFSFDTNNLLQVKPLGIFLYYASCFFKQSALYHVLLHLSQRRLMIQKKKKKQWLKILLLVILFHFFPFGHNEEDSQQEQNE